MLFCALSLLAILPRVSDARLMVVRDDALSFLEPPEGVTKGLFIPARHRCNETHLAEYLKHHPEQGEKTKSLLEIQNSLKIVHNVLEENGLPTILEGGSSLGFFRNCGVIPADRDGDVALLGHWLNEDKVDLIEKSFQKRNARLERGLCPKGVTYSGCEMRATFQDRSYVDLLVYAQDSACDKAPCSFFYGLWPVGSVGPAYYRCNAGPIHFEQVNFLSKVFWIQTPTVEYLKDNYGEQWEDPTGGVYKSCNFDTKEAPKKVDNFEGATPPASYVLGLQNVDPPKSLPPNLAELRSTLGLQTPTHIRIFVDLMTVNWCRQRGVFCEVCLCR